MWESSQPEGDALSTGQQGLSDSESHASEQWSGQTLLSGRKKARLREDWLKTLEGRHLSRIRLLLESILLGLWMRNEGGGGPKSAFPGLLWFLKQPGTVSRSNTKIVWTQANLSLMNPEVAKALQVH